MAQRARQERARRGGHTQEKRDLYATLGVPRDADAAALKKAYRKLARELHPDVKPDDPVAEERFKQVSEAYNILSDPERRALYDEFGELALDPNFDAKAAQQMRDAFGGAEFGGFGSGGGGPGPEAGGYPGGLGDLFADLFSGAGTAGTREAGPRRRRPLRMRGPDVRSELELDFVEAALGGERRVTVPRPTADGGITTESLRVRIPPGVGDGGEIRLAGKGGEGLNGGPPGDLYARVRVRPHRFFWREGRDLHLEVPVSVSEAVLGAELEVPTLGGRIKVTLPPGTDSGAKLRVRGKGIPAGRGLEAGDLYAHVKIVVPRSLDAESRAAFERLAGRDGADLRRDLLGTG